MGRNRIPSFERLWCVTSVALWGWKFLAPCLSSTSCNLIMQWWLSLTEKDRVSELSLIIHIVAQKDSYLWLSLFTWLLLLRLKRLKLRTEKRGIKILTDFCLFVLVCLLTSSDVSLRSQKKKFRLRDLVCHYSLYDIQQVHVLQSLFLLP